MKVLKIEMSREFRSLGYFTPAEVKDRFKKGDFKAGDFGRYEDSGEWRPVEIVVNTMKIEPLDPPKKETPHVEAKIVEPQKAVKAREEVPVEAKAKPRKAAPKEAAPDEEPKKKRGRAAATGVSRKKS